MSRPTFRETFLAIAEVLSRRATCPRARVGAVIVDMQNHIVGCGYNGAPSGEPHCTEVGCDVQEDEDGVEHCLRVDHADANAITYAPDMAPLRGATMYIYSTLPGQVPCPDCQRMIDQVGIVEVVCSYGRR